MAYLYTQNVKVLTYQEVVEEKEKLVELYKRVNELQIILGYIEIYLTDKDELLKPTNIRKVVEDVLKFYQIPSSVQGNCYALADEAIYSVDVKLVDLGDECEIRIIDYGIGIPSEIKRKIVVKKVVERYGGRVWVEDSKPKGATFVLRLKTKPS